MKRPRLDRWIQQIYDTEEHEISCSECFEAISQYVDLEIAGEPVEERRPQVKQHLGQCRVCQEEYELLLALARDEAGGGTES